VKLHELKPAPGSRKERTRVGRGIAAGKGKTAGRGTKGQKSRAGASIPAWFEGGQTPIHIRVPKLRGFKRRFRIEYQVVNVGRISQYAADGRFGLEADAAQGEGAPAKGEPQTVNAAVLAAAGLIRSADRPLKVLGQGDVDQKLFVAADAMTASARRKIEEAGGFVQLLASTPAEEAEQSGDEPEPAPTAEPAADESSAATEASAASQAASAVEPEASGTAEQAPEQEEASPPEPKPTRRRKPAQGRGRAETDSPEPAEPAQEESTQTGEDEPAEDAKPRRRAKSQD
jgi:large subunit ribosomal protein L15